MSINEANKIINVCKYVLRVTLDTALERKKVCNENCSN